MKPFKVHLRRKEIKNNQASLYLDFGRAVYHAGKNKLTRRDFLGLFIYLAPRTKLERTHNRETIELAERKRAETQIAIQNGTYGVTETDEQRERRRLDTDFLAFFRARLNQRKENTQIKWQTGYNHFFNFTQGECRIKNISKGFLLAYKDYLNEIGLAQNTKFSLFSIIKTVVKEAYDRELLTKNYASEVQNFPVSQSQRPFFLDKEVKKLKETPFPALPALRRAGLFSILTSLRWSDILTLRYEMIQHDSTLGYYIDFKTKKVDCPEILYLTEEALKICEYKAYKKGRMFPLKYWAKERLSEWFALAGLKKPEGIEFHIFRHTFAMRALNKGESIEAVSAMMGHKNIATTQKYAKLLGITKRAAVHKVTLG